MAVTDLSVLTSISTYDQSIAKSMVDAILRAGEFRLEANGKTFVVPRSVTNQIVAALTLAANDLPMESLLAEQELSVQKAADFLDTSTRHVNDMLNNGIIQYKNHNLHRMVLLDSLLEYDRELKRKLSLLEKIVMLSEEVGLYDDE